MKDTLVRQNALSNKQWEQLLKFFYLTQSSLGNNFNK
jgi:hypothetical protein